MKGLSESETIVHEAGLEFSNWAWLCRSLQEHAGNFLHKAATEETLQLLTGTAQNLIREMDAGGFPPRICSPFEGARIISTKAFFRDRQSIGFQWALAPWPYTRLGDVENAMTLGWFEEYDLWIGFQGWLQPTLIAKYGNHPSEYLTLNPSIFRALGIDHLRAALATLGPHMNAAFDRAVNMGYMQEWAA